MIFFLFLHRRGVSLLPREGTSLVGTPVYVDSFLFYLFFPSRGGFQSPATASRPVNGWSSFSLTVETENVVSSFFR